LVIEQASFYPKFCNVGNKKIDYKDINHIEFHSSTAELNFVVSRDIVFAIHHSNNERTLIIGNLEKGLIESRPSKIIAEQLNLAFNFISKQTLKQRVINYNDQLADNGYFTYKEIYKFHSNGDLEVDGKIRTNLKKRWESKDIDWMTSSKSHNSSSYNPYEFSVKNDNVEWYNVIGKTTFIETTFDKDIFDPMLIMFFRNGRYFPDGEIKRDKIEIEENDDEQQIKSLKEFPNFEKFIKLFEVEYKTKLALVDNSIDVNNNKVCGHTQLIFDLQNEPQYIFKFLFGYNASIKDISLTGYIIPWSNPKEQVTMEIVYTINTGKSTDLTIEKYRELHLDVFKNAMVKKELNYEMFKFSRE
jgi:hypothetical protein